MFGPEAEGFKDLGSAFLQILIWIISGRITDETVNEKVDSGTKAVFFIFLIVLDPSLKQLNFLLGDMSFDFVKNVYGNFG